MEKRRKNREKEQGFSLVEIMAVLIIMALIALTAGAVVMNRVKNAKINFTKMQIRSIGDNITTYKLEKDTYPESLSALVPNYIDSADKMKDGWGNDFLFLNPGDNGPFDLISGGPDKSVDTPEDNINSWALGKTDD